MGKWRKRKACRKRELQSLAGLLCYACKVLRPGRRFLWCVFNLPYQFRHIMIRLNAAFRADLEWWHAFAGKWNGVSMMVDVSVSESLVRQLGVWGAVEEEVVASSLGGLQVV